jgi:hypothetical protein
MGGILSRDHHRRLLVRHNHCYGAMQQNIALHNDYYLGNAPGTPGPWR